MKFVQHQNTKKSIAMIIRLIFSTIMLFIAAATSVSVAATPTFNKDIAPILFKHCAACHRSGEVAPFPLLTYQDAAKRADFLKDVTTERRMPPWMPEPGPHRFLDERRLSEVELKTLSAWADGGTPEGDAKDLPAEPQFPNGWQLGQPDLIVEMPEPFQVPADGPDVYQAFVIRVPVDTMKWVKAIEFRPGTRRVVHHATLLLDSSGEMRRRDENEAGPGFLTQSGLDLIQLQQAGGQFGSWTPGATPRFMPEGVARPLRPETDLVMLIHYHPSGKAEVDQSKVGIFFSDKPNSKPMTTLPMAVSPRVGNQNLLSIPAGKARHEVRLERLLPGTARVFGVIPHAHYLLRELKVTATQPNGKQEQILWIKDWDFNWQDRYAFEEPPTLKAGTRLELVATFDNSENNPQNPNHPPKAVRYGPNSTDEMLGVHLALMPVDAESAVALQGARGGNPMADGFPIPDNAPAMLKRFDRDNNGRMSEDEIEAMPTQLKDRIRNTIRERIGGSKVDSNPSSKNTKAARNLDSPLKLAKTALDLTIAVRDLKKAEEFYGDILGMKPLGLERLPTGEAVQPYQFGGSVFRLVAYANLPTANGTSRMQDIRGYRVLTLAPTDLGAIEVRGKKLGYAAWKSPMPGGPVRMWSDPDGNTIELIDGSQADSMGDGLVVPNGVMVGIVVSDAKRAKAFYEETLGFHLIQERPARALGVMGYYYKLGDTIVKFWEIQGDLPNTYGPPSANAGYRHLTAEVTQADRLENELSQKGVTILASPEGSSSATIAKQIWIEDTDGNRIQFVESRQ